MPEPQLYFDRSQLSRLHRTFELGEEFEDKFANLMAFVGGAIRASAQNAARAASTRVADSIEMEMQVKSDGEYVMSVGSTFQGYPTYPGDTVGAAGEAESKGWATFAHRIHFGYSGENPRAGFTAPTPFLLPFFEHWSNAFFETVKDEMIQQVIRGY